LEETVPLEAISVEGISLISAVGDYDGMVHHDVTKYYRRHEPNIKTTHGLDVAGLDTNCQVRAGDEKIYYTLTGESGWIETEEFRGPQGEVAVSANCKSVLLTTAGVTYHTENFGTNWTRVSNLTALRAVADRVADNKFYAYENDGSFKVSVDGGLTFAEVSTLPSGGSEVVRAAPGIEGDVWVALKAGGLARTTDSGTSFELLAVADARTVGFGKAAEGRSYFAIYIWGKPTASSTMGVYRSIDEANSWERVNDDKHQYGGPNDGNFLIGDMNEFGTWFLATGGRGIAYGRLSSNMNTAPTPPSTPSSPDYTMGTVAMGGAGYVAGIVTRTEEPHLTYIRTDVGGMYKWDGSKWNPLMDWVSYEDQGLLGVETLALDPKDPSRLYAVAARDDRSNGKTAFLRSTDYGETFEVIDVSHVWKAHGNGMGRVTGEKLVVDPGSSNVLYCGTRLDGLLKSTDYGSTWSKITSLNVTALAEDDPLPGYAWDGITDLFWRNGVSLVHPDPNSVDKGVAQRIFVGVSNFNGPSFFVSNDAGETWTEAAGGPAGFAPVRVAMRGTNELIVTFASAPGPWDVWGGGRAYRFTIDSGLWTQIISHEHGFGGVDVHPKNPDVIIMSSLAVYAQQGEPKQGEGEYVYRSEDGGNTWVNLMDNYTRSAYGDVEWIKHGTTADYSIHWGGCLKFDPSDYKKVWITSGNGIWRSTDIGASAVNWEFTVAGLEETVPLEAISVEGISLISAVGDYDGMVHHDITKYYRRHEPNIKTTHGLDVAGLDTNCQVRAGDEKIYYTLTGESGWIETEEFRGPQGEVAVSANCKSVLLTTAGVTYHTENFGTNWTRVSNLTALRAVADRVADNKFYAYENDGSFKVSVDGGLTFAEVSTLPSGGSEVVRAAPGIEGDVWVALKAGGLARTTDSGTSFELLAVADARTVGFGKAAEGRSYFAIYIWGKPTASSTMGVYRSIDEANSWERVNDDKHQYGGPNDGNFLIGDMNEFGTWFLATGGRGIAYGRLPPKCTSWADEKWYGFATTPDKSWHVE
ncbi:Xyloglucanase Xgh74A, partial [Diplonema papillatum]